MVIRKVRSMQSIQKSKRKKIAQPKVGSKRKSSLFEDFAKRDLDNEFESFDKQLDSIIEDHLDDMQ